MKAITALIALGAGGAVYYFATKASAKTVTVGGRTWKLKPAGKNAAGLELTDVIAPAGSWGPHAEMLVLRFNTTTSGVKTLEAVGQNVPQAMRDAALSAFEVRIPGT